MVRHTDMDMLVIKGEIPRKKRHGHTMQGPWGYTRRQREGRKLSKSLYCGFCRKG